MEHIPRRHRRALLIEARKKRNHPDGTSTSAGRSGANHPSNQRTPGTPFTQPSLIAATFDHFRARVLPATRMLTERSPHTKTAHRATVETNHAAPTALDRRVMSAPHRKFARFRENAHHRCESRLFVIKPLHSLPRRYTVIAR
ncbi:hypothetical protein [Microbacterium paraoxydans]|uniref:hypothetical protein n=1 Tax=Microbacterium paraoxydans TaxID=199592 RepID=UPI0012F88442|nr:hypothetical protein [Microbacterium paraoxydans]